jgi:hypothetical protein
MAMKRGAVVVALIVLAGCGGGDESAQLEFTRADGSSAPFPSEVGAWCGPYDDESPDVEGVHVFAGELPRDDTPSSFWMLQAVRDDIERDAATVLPNDFVYTEPRGASFFAFDVEDRENELSSAEEESSGTIRVELDGCEPGDTVTVELDDVVLGSEYHDLPTMSVSGAAVAEIGEPPA